MSLEEVKAKLTKLKRFKTYITNNLIDAPTERLNKWKLKLTETKLEAETIWEVLFAEDINDEVSDELETIEGAIKEAFKDSMEKLDEFLAIISSKEAEANEQIEVERQAEKEKQKIELEKQKENEKIEADKRNKERLEKEKEKSEKEKQAAEVDLVDSDDESIRGASSNHFGPVVQLKLDRIQLPAFAGDWIEWNGFKDLFIALVHENKNLSDTVKFHQLRNHLKGQAAETIRGYKVTDINYKAAWKDLCVRYDRADPIIDEYIRKFFEMPIVPSNPNGQKLQIIIDGTNQLIRALPTFDVDVSSWDSILKFIIVSKLDEKTRNDWKQLIGREERVSLNRLLEFLETRAIQMQPLQGERLMQMLAHNNNSKAFNRPKKIFHIEENKNNNQKVENKSKPMEGTPENCAQCGGSHALYRCRDILKEKASDRTKIIRDQLHRCIKCLGQHERGQCEFKKCPYCGGPHNTLLCYQKEHDYIQQKRSEREGENSNVHTLSKN